MAAVAVESLVHLQVRPSKAVRILLVVRKGSQVVNWDVVGPNICFSIGMVFLMVGTIWNLINSLLQ